jgi:ribosomal RNA-processing protein 17
VNEVNALLKQASGDMSEAADTDAEDDENEFQGFDEELPPPIDREEEYIDEDRYTTVTVESVDVNKSGFSKPDGEDGSKEDGDETKDADGKKRVWTKENPKKDRPKKRKVKFRYETKSERKITRFKERSKNRSQAKARRD